MSGKIRSREYSQGPQHYLKRNTGGQKPMAQAPILAKDGFLELVKVMGSYGPHKIATTKFVQWKKPSFPQIMTVVRWSMLDWSVIITDLHKVCKTYRMVSEASGFQEEEVGQQSGRKEEAVEY